MDTKDRIAGGLIGVAVGDALGVPVEFVERAALDRDPVTGLRGHGTHDQPAGTWSDDTSLTMCLAESLCDGFDVRDQARRFVGWLYDGAWTAHGAVFDVGNTTRDAIARLARGVEPTVAGGADQYANGNGSLMRTLPIALHRRAATPETRRREAMSASALTHRHIRSQLACALYVEVAAGLCRGAAPDDAVRAAQRTYREFIEREHPHERLAFTRTLDENLKHYPRHEIESSGYVVHTLDASLWCLLSTTSFAEAVLKAVNLGEDSDTTGAVTGGLAGVAYGYDSIPHEWRARLARHDDILAVARRLTAKTQAANDT